jgi:hypothetical protein
MPEFNPQTLASLRDALADFQKHPLREACAELLSALGYQSDKTAEFVTHLKQFSKAPAAFDEKKAQVAQWRDTVQAELPLEGGKPDAQGGKRTLPDLPPELTAHLPKPGQRLSTAGRRQLIRDLCGWQPLRGEELATLLHKDLKYLRNKHLTEMMHGGELAFLFPESPNHALQAYTLPANKGQSS